MTNEELRQRVYTIHGRLFDIEITRDLQWRLRIRFSGRYPEKVEQRAAYLESVNSAPDAAFEMLWKEFRKELAADDPAKW